MVHGISTAYDKMTMHKAFLLLGFGLIKSFQ